MGLHILVGRIAAVSRRSQSPRRRLNRLFHLTALVSAIFASTVGANAQSSRAYDYDARGRLVEVRDGIGAKSRYSLDRADNRANVTVADQFTTSWEAESLPHLIGYADQNGWAANVTLGPGFLTYGPYTPNIPVGSHVATWRTLIDVTAVADDSPVATVDIWDATAGQQLASKTLTRHNWVAGFAHQIIELPFSIDPSRLGHQIELRTYYIGAAYLRVDKIGYYTAATGPAVSFSITSNGAVTEGGNSVFTVSKSGTTSSSFSVNYATAAGTAGSPLDFTAQSGALNFGPADINKTISVATIDDALVEGAENFHVDLTGPSPGATIATSRATAVITDNDEDPPSFSVSDVSANEGAGLVFTVTKAGTVNNSYAVNYATANGTAIAGSDYTASTGTLTFAAAETTKTVSVATIDDSAVESSETVLLNLSGATGGAAISDSQGVGTIIDNDVASGPSFSINNVTVDQGANAVFTITKTGSTSSTITINYATANGTAVAGTHYVAKSGTLSFGPSVNSLTVSVSTLYTGATVNRGFYLNLSSPSGGSISDSQGQATIRREDTCTLCLQSTDTPEEEIIDEPPPD